jgi:hypothetical protein
MLGSITFFSPDCRAPGTRPALSEEFCLDAQCAGPGTPLIMLEYHLRPDIPYVYISRDVDDACHSMILRTL